MITLDDVDPCTAGNEIRSAVFQVEVSPGRFLEQGLQPDAAKRSLEIRCIIEALDVGGRRYRS